MEKNKRHGTQTLETVKTIILAALVISLAALLVVYIGGTHIYQSMTDTDEKKVFDKLWSVQDGQRSAGLQKDRLLPEMIGYRVSGAEPICAIADTASVSALYEVISPCLIELFGSGSVCEEIDGETLFSGAVMSGEYIFIRWHEPVLYQLIYAYAAGRLTVSETDTAVFKGDDGAYIKEIVIVPESDVAAHRFVAIAKDSDGRYFRFSRDPGALASDFHIPKLSEVSAKVTTVPFEFTTDGVLKLEPLVMSEIVSTDIEEIPTVLPNERYDQLLTLFGCNPDKLGSYHYDSGVVYYDSHSRVRIENGRISYQETEDNSGVSLAQILGYSVDGGFTVFDKLAAVDYLLTKLYGISQEFQGSAKLCLGNVYTENSLLVFEYFYTYNDIRVGGTAVKAVFGNDTLRLFEFDAVNIQPTDSVSLLTTPGYVARKLAANGSLDEIDEAASVSLLYKNGKAAWQIKSK